MSALLSIIICLGLAGINMACQTPQMASTSTTGYHHLPDIGYYKFHTTRTLWPMAKRTCEHEGGHLVVLNSDSEAVAMKQLMRANRKNIESAGSVVVVWVGVVESATSQGEFYTVLGEPLNATGFNRWRHGHPRQPSLGDHVIFWSDNDQLQDLSADLDYKYPYICERTLM